jgi:hypothetical protein
MYIKIVMSPVGTIFSGFNYDNAYKYTPNAISNVHPIQENGPPDLPGDMKYLTGGERIEPPTLVFSPTSI